MRTGRLKTGIHLVAGGIFLIILATFFHDQFAILLHLSHGQKAWLIFAGLLSGGLLGFAGILLSVAGFLGAPGTGRNNVLPDILVMLLLVLLFFFLLLFPLEDSPKERLAPGETITI